VIYVGKEVLNTGCERHNACIHRHIMLSIVYVVSHHLNTEVRHGIESLLGKEDSAYPLRTLKMAKFKCDKLL
jgi:hypothetical protein